MLCMAEEHPQAGVIRSLLDSTDRTAAWLAKQIGTSKQSVHAWLYEGRMPRSPEVWDEMRQALSAKGDNQLGLNLPSSMPMVKMPVLRSGSAGRGDNNDVDAILEVPVQLNYPDYRCLELYGQSMEEVLKPGDVLVFRQNPHPRVGYVSAIEIEGEVFVKEIQYRDGLYYMHSFNPQFEDCLMPEGATVLGFLVAYYRDFDDEQFYRHKRGGLKF